MSQPPHAPGPDGPQHSGPAGPQHPGPDGPHHPGPAGPQHPDQSPQGGSTARSKGPIIAAVGCGLLIVLLVLSVVGFFGVRALMGEDESAEQSSAPQEETPADEAPAGDAPAEDAPGADDPAEEEPTTEEPTTEEPAEEEVAAGEENAVPHGTVITLPELDMYEGSLDISLGEVEWDATDWVNEQNSHNPKPTDQGKYVMVQAELTYHGPDTFTSYGFMPVDYVAPDGTAYEEAGVVTPDTTEKLNLADGESGTVHWVFMIPADTPEGGHFVLADALPQDEALVEGQWVEAA